MACEKHGYSNPTFCPACDQEVYDDLMEKLPGKIKALQEKVEALEAQIAARKEHPNFIPSHKGMGN